MISVFHDKLPDGCWKARYEAEFYRLLPRKRQAYEGNREFKSIRYLIFSKYSRKFYERTLSDADTEENIAYYLLQGLLYIYPTDEDKEEIREDVEKEKLGYWLLNKRRQAEMDWDRQRGLRNDGNGFQYRLNKKRETINKLKVKKKKP